jgi:hypothetical protein
VLGAHRVGQTRGEFRCSPPDPGIRVGRELVPLVVVEGPEAKQRAHRCGANRRCFSTDGAPNRLEIPAMASLDDVTRSNVSG